MFIGIESQNTSGVYDFSHINPEKTEVEEEEIAREGKKTPILFLYTQIIL